MVGAMSFVNKSVPADTTVVGVPAKVIKNIGYPIENTVYGRNLIKEEEQANNNEFNG